MHAHTKGAHDAYTTGEKGDGFYSLHTKGCFDVIANAKSDILNVLAKMDVNKPGSFNIADFGTADGGTSMPTRSSADGPVTLCSWCISRPSRRVASWACLVVMC